MAANQFHSAAPDAGAAPMAPMMGTGRYPETLQPQSQGTPPHRHQQPSLGDPYTPQQQATLLRNQQASDAYQQSEARSVKRPRPVKSCTECRKRKLKCSRLCPCSQCQKSNRICKYTADADSGNFSDGSDGEIVEVDRSVRRNYLGVTAGGIAVTGGESASGQGSSGDTGSRSLLEDLTSRMEKLEKHLMSRNTQGEERAPAPSIAANPETLRGLTIKENAWRTRFFGQSSSRVLLNLFDDARESMAHPDVREVLRSYSMVHNFLQDNHQKALAPITVFVDSMMPVKKRMMDILPKKPVCDRLVAAYMHTSEAFYRMIHFPTFQEEYRLYWDGHLQCESFLPQLLAVLSTASRFETKSKGLGNERVEGVHIPTACALVRSWLDGLRGKQLTDFKTLQVEMLLLHAQRMVKPRIQDSWTQLGYIVRLAMNMGLHRDPSEFEPRMTVFQGEIRRRLWFTILDMDLHLSLSSNMPCLVRENDFSCRHPRNLNDVDLFPNMTELPPSKPIDQYTDNQLQVYAALTLGTRMRVCNLINRVDNMHDYDEILEIGSRLDRFLEDINYIFPRQGIVNDAQKSRLWRSRVVVDMHVRRPLLALYRPFAIGAPNAPGVISRAYLRSSMVILKYLDEIDPTLPHFQEMADMYCQILKGDIIQAALSVCFYIQSATRPTASASALGQQGLRMSPDDADEILPYNPHNSVLWSPARLISTVEQTLDLLVRNIGGRDTKDVVCLTVVLDCVKRAEPNTDEIVRGLRAVLGGCFRATNLSPEKLAGHVRGPTAREMYPVDAYGQARGPYMLHDSNVGLPAADEVDDWIMWEGWE